MKFIKVLKTNIWLFAFPWIGLNLSPFHLKICLFILITVGLELFCGYIFEGSFELYWSKRQIAKFNGTAEQAKNIYREILLGTVCLFLNAGLYPLLFSVYDISVQFFFVETSLVCSVWLNTYRSPLYINRIVKTQYYEQLKIFSTVTLFVPLLCAYAAYRITKRGGLCAAVFAIVFSGLIVIYIFQLMIITRQQEINDKQ